MVVGEIKRWKVFCQPVGGRKAAIAVGWCCFCHFDGALGETLQGFGVYRRARYKSLLLADNGAQAQIAAFRTFGIFKLTQAAGDIERGTFAHHRIGAVGTERQR